MISILKGLLVYQTTIHCRIKNFSHLIDQNYRHVKKRFAKSAGFQNLRHAPRTIKGIETIHALYKKGEVFKETPPFLMYNELQQLLANS